MLHLMILYICGRLIRERNSSFFMEAFCDHRHHSEFVGETGLPLDGKTSPCLSLLRNLLSSLGEITEGLCSYCLFIFIFFTVTSLIDYKSKKWKQLAGFPPRNQTGNVTKKRGDLLDLVNLVPNYSHSPSFLQDKINISNLNL